MLRVLIAERSRADQELLVRALESDGDIRVVGRANDGAQAVELARRLRPDVIAMAISMPQLDGFEATREIMISAPTPIILVSSSANGREVELSMKAMEVGALMVLAKPDFANLLGVDDERARFVAMAKAMAQVRVVRRSPTLGLPSRLSRSKAPLRPSGPTRVIAIAASTGGPTAVRQILCDLPRDLPVPVLVVQHMTLGFTSTLVTWLQTSCALPVKIAEHRKPLVAGTVFIAPDELHLGISASGVDLIAPSACSESFCPSANILFETAARVYGAGVAAVILTGMGSDGVRGLRAVKAAGGVVLAQDEATSVIYGMPREASLAGVVTEELPLTEIAPRLSALAAGGIHGRQHSRR